MNGLPEAAIRSNPCRQKGSHRPTPNWSVPFLAVENNTLISWTTQQTGLDRTSRTDEIDSDSRCCALSLHSVSVPACTKLGSRAFAALFGHLWVLYALAAAAIEEVRCVCLASRPRLFKMTTHSRHPPNFPHDAQ